MELVVQDRVDGLGRKLGGRRVTRPQNNGEQQAPRTLGIILNDQCGLRCRHCSLGYSAEHHGTRWKIDEPELRRIILDADRNVYRIVLMAGGEPSLVPRLVRAGIDACRDTGLMSGLITAPVWAATEAAATRFLTTVSGLDILMLSYDVFHLEFLSTDHYRHAVREAHARGLRVHLNLCYSTRAEAADLLEQVECVKHWIDYVHHQPVLPFGNAQSIMLDALRVDTASDMKALPRSCVAGNSLFNRDGHLYACCWAAKVDESPIRYSYAATLGFALTSACMEEDVVFQIIRQNGFIGSLSDHNEEKTLLLAQGKQFVNECDLCVHVMREGGSEGWRALIGGAVDEVSDRRV